MAEKYTKKSIIAEIFVLIFVIFAVAIFVTFFKAIESGREDDNMVTIDQVYDVTLNDKKYDKTTTLPDSSLPRPGKGDTVSFSFVLPDEKIADPELSIYVDHAALKVYFNDELVFEKGNKDRKPFPVSFAYGFCLSDDDKIPEIGDTSDKVEEVYKISDERMYEHKKEMKKANSV